MFRNIPVFLFKGEKKIFKVKSFFKSCTHLLFVELWPWRVPASAPFFSFSVEGYYKCLFRSVVLSKMSYKNGLHKMTVQLHSKNVSLP